MADMATKLGRLQNGASRYKKPQEPLWYWDLVVVARDGIEPPTRVFSVLFSPSVCSCVAVGYRGG